MTEDRYDRTQRELRDGTRESVAKEDPEHEQRKGGVRGWLQRVDEGHKERSILREQGKKAEKAAYAESYVKGKAERGKRKGAEAAQKGGNLERVGGFLKEQIKGSFGPQYRTVKTVKGKGKNRVVTYTKERVSGGGLGFDVVGGFSEVLGVGSSSKGGGPDTSDLERSLGMGSTGRGKGPTDLERSLSGKDGGGGFGDLEGSLGIGSGRSRKGRTITEKDLGL